jgi:hypothetical protein
MTAEIEFHFNIHCKKRLAISPPQPGCHSPNSPWRGINLIIPARESLVSDIPAGDGKSLTFFNSVFSRRDKMVLFAVKTWLKTVPT